MKRLRKPQKGPWVEEQRAEDNVKIVLRGPDGKVKREVTGHNLITTVGKEKLAERGVMASPATEGPKYIAIGKSGTAAAVGNTTLGEESTRAEATTRSVTGAVGTLKKVFAAGEGTGALKEAGTLSAAAAGTLYSRIVFEVVNKEAGDSLEIVWTLTQA